VVATIYDGDRAQPHRAPVADDEQRRTDGRRDDRSDQRDRGQRPERRDRRTSAVRVGQSRRRGPRGRSYLRPHLALRVRGPRNLLTDRHFASPVLVQCLTVAGFFVYIGSSSFVLQDDLGISRCTYTLVFTSNALAMVAASLVFRLLVMRFGAVRLRRIAIILQTSAVLVLFAATLLDGDHRPPLPVIWIALATMTAGLGMFLPANSAITQNAGRRLSGTASALGGGLPFMTGASTTPLTGAFGSQTVLMMATCMAVPFALAAVAAVSLRRWTVEPGDEDLLQPPNDALDEGAAAPPYLDRSVVRA
jgi:MFS transporter